jgi:hypothetical protein
LCVSIVYLTFIYTRERLLVNMEDDYAFSHLTEQPDADADEETSGVLASLPDFIKHETISSKKISKHIVIETFACTLWKGFFDMKHRLYKIQNLDVQLAVETGIRLINNLFWILFNCSSNLQLTLFLTERGRLLYSEFLSMSRTHALMQNAEHFPSIQDGFQFAIKKSIGTLTCSVRDDTTDYYNNAYSIPFEKISTYRSIYRCIFENINKRYLSHESETPWSDDNINLSLHKLNHLLTTTLQKPHVTEVMFYVITQFPQTMPNTNEIQLLNGLCLHAYLLFLRLLCTRSFLKNAQKLQSTEIDARLSTLLQFITQTKVELDDSLYFLSDNHSIQTKWIDICKTEL